MKVFVTGASGFVGTALLPRLVAAGHEVVGLARSDASAAAVEAAGAAPLRGDLDDLDTLRDGAAASDGVVHLAYRHDFADVDAAVRTDRAAIDAIGSALAGSGRTFVIASGTPIVPGRPSVEADDPEDGLLAARLETARRFLALSERGVRTTSVRLPRTVHDDLGRGGFAGMLVQIAQQAGVSGYVGDGAARWPAVHVADAARLFQVALEKGPARGVLHAVDEEGITLLDTATAIGRALDLPVREVAADSLGFLGALAAVDQPASSAWTREQLGWAPSGRGLLDALGQARSAV
ncbi:nucleoside-diphosphate-sugar epimerase [Cellulosimicrobium cellulans]|jgi:nucleoside-diphosphate-sugar epimerase|uniref:3-beta hydroxysteroid dehydrogenase n=1 Tax=Cellulosimicrobium cellulans TaxID=1710 RepID=A0A1Y0HUK3_CELCE|nr:NAD-dependent epimerase/dehydratase family protein [Cellulosimicrobium cellulans]ARU51858.1 3-beta hydroxysteroid dehydrogenase [Cellulosimicrobium cellulans]MBM7818361.1 nucleoside-diphosphate-sugar epimerase [Cellulosimicrobium cellulans]